MRVQGWALDVDTSSPIGVHLYVDGRALAVRADVAGLVRDWLAEVLP